MELLARGVPTMQVEQLKAVKPPEPIRRPEFIKPEKAQTHEIVMSPSEFMSWSLSNAWARGG